MHPWHALALGAVSLYTASRMLTERSGGMCANTLKASMQACCMPVTSTKLRSAMAEVNKTTKSETFTNERNAYDSLAGPVYAYTLVDKPEADRLIGGRERPLIVSPNSPANVTCDLGEDLSVDLDVADRADGGVKTDDSEDASWTLLAYETSAEPPSISGCGMRTPRGSGGYPAACMKGNECVLPCH